MAGTMAGIKTSNSRSTIFAVLAICISSLLCISVWFSASFIIDGISIGWQVSEKHLFWVTFGVQAGFILGAITSAVLRLSNRFRVRSLFITCATGAATSNILLLIFTNFEAVLVLRLLTGVFLAGIYPVAVREILAWVIPSRRGLASSALLAALTIGSAAPHLVNVFGQADWRVVIIVTSICSAAGGLIFLLVPVTAPYRDNHTQINFRQGLSVLKDRKVLLVNLAYFSHMWELYAMWAFVGTLISHRLTARSVPAELIATASFAVIALGAIGCVSAGLLGDRFGKILTAQIFAILSGGVAVAITLSTTWSPTVLLALCAIWGLTVVGDSALLSALLRDYCPEAHVGSALSVQMAGGYAVSAGSIALLPILASYSSWEQGILSLVAGPIVGIIILQLLKSKGRVESRTKEQSTDRFPICQQSPMLR